MQKRTRPLWFTVALLLILVLNVVILVVLSCCQYPEPVVEAPEPPPEPPPPPPPPTEPMLPEFPLPPPQASATVVIPFEFLRKPSDDIVHLYDVDRVLCSALDSCGYSEKSYYAVPDGFAIVTRLEQINPDGTPKESTYRWVTELPPIQFSLKDYLKALFTARVGYYRLIVFVVTPHAFSQTKDTLSHGEAEGWLSAGLNKLPSSIGLREYSEEYACTALIYEFERSDLEKDAEIKVPGRLTGRTHLKKAKIWNLLEE